MNVSPSQPPELPTMANQAKANEIQKEEPQIIGIEDHLPADLPTQSKKSRFDFYTSIAKRKHNITIGGRDNQGVFADLLVKFPGLRSEVDDVWYIMRKGELRLCRSKHHGIVNTNTTTFKNCDRSYGPDDTEKVTSHRVTELFDRWHKQLRQAMAGKNSALAKILTRRSSGSEPVQREPAKGAFKAGAWDRSSNGDAFFPPVGGFVLQSIERDIHQPANRDEQRPQNVGKRIQPQIFNNSNELSNRKRQYSAAFGDSTRAPQIEHGMQPSSIKRLNDLGDQVRKKIAEQSRSVPSQEMTRVENGMSFHNNPDYLSEQLRQAQVLTGKQIGAAQIQHEMQTPSANGAVRLADFEQIGKEDLGSVQIGGLLCSPFNNHPNQMNGQMRQRPMPAPNGSLQGPENNRANQMRGQIGQPSVPLQNGFPRGPDNSLSCQAKDMMKHRDVINTGNAFGAVQMGGRTSVPLMSHSNNVNGRPLQESSVPPQHSIYSASIQHGYGIQPSTIHTLYGHSMPPGSHYPLWLSPAISMPQPPVSNRTPIIPTQNNFAPKVFANSQNQIRTAIEIEYSLILQKYMVNEDGRSILYGLYQRLHHAVLAQDQPAERQIQSEIDDFVSYLEPKQILGSEKNDLAHTQNPVRNGVQSAPNGILRIPSQIGTIPQPLSKQEQKDLFSRLTIDCQNRIRELSLDDADQKTLKGFYQAHFRARRTGDAQLALIAQRAIESFKQGGQQAIKSMREMANGAAPTLIHPTHNGFQTPASHSPCSENGQSSTEYRMQKFNQPKQTSNQDNIGTLLATDIDHGTVNSQQILTDKYFAAHDLCFPVRDDRPRHAVSSLDAKLLQTRRSRHNGAILPFMSLDFNNLDSLAQCPSPFLRNMKSQNLPEGGKVEQLRQYSSLFCVTFHAILQLSPEEQAARILYVEEQYGKWQKEARLHMQKELKVNENEKIWQRVALSEFFTHPIDKGDVEEPQRQGGRPPKNGTIAVEEVVQVLNLEPTPTTPDSPKNEVFQVDEHNPSFSFDQPWDEPEESASMDWLDELRPPTPPPPRENLRECFCPKELTDNLNSAFFAEARRLGVLRNNNIMAKLKHCYEDIRDSTFDRDWPRLGGANAALRAVRERLELERLEREAKTSADDKVEIVEENDGSPDDDAETLKQQTSKKGKKRRVKGPRGWQPTFKRGKRETEECMASSTARASKEVVNEAEILDSETRTVEEQPLGVTAVLEDLAALEVPKIPRKRGRPRKDAQQQITFRESLLQKDDKAKIQPISLAVAETEWSIKATETLGQETVQEPRRSGRPRKKLLQETQEQPALSPKSSKVANEKRFPCLSPLKPPNIGPAEEGAPIASSWVAEALEAPKEELEKRVTRAEAVSKQQHPNHGNWFGWWKKR